MNLPPPCLRTPLADRLRPVLRRFLVGGLVTLSGLGHLHAQTSYVSLDQNGLWSDPAFWTPDAGAAEPYPHLDGHQAHVGESIGQRQLTVDDNVTLEMLNIWGGRILSPVEGSEATITLRADPGRPGSVPEFRVAAAGGGNTKPNVESLVNLQAGLHLHLIGGIMNFGSGSRAGHARVKLESGATLNAGTASSRTEWIVGRQTDARSDERTSFLNGEAGSEFTGYFSSIKIAANDAGSMDPGGLPNIKGSVDLTEATVHAFDVSGDVSIGKGATLGGGYGELRLPKLDALIGGNLIVGDTMTDSSGLLELRETHVEVGGDVTLNLTGKVKVTISDTAAGLRLSENSALTITATGSHAGDADAGYFMQFTGEGFAEGLLYGLAWEGNRTSELQALIDSFAITWTSTLDTAPQLYYDASANTTFIGYAPIPEPGHLSLVLAGGLIVGGLAARKALHGRRVAP